MSDLDGDNLLAGEAEPLGAERGKSDVVDA